MRASELELSFFSPGYQICAMKNRRTAGLVSRKMSENVFNDYYNYTESVNLEYEAFRSCGKIAALVCFFLLLNE